MIDLLTPLLVALTHPGVDTWTGRAAVACWLALAYLVVSIVRGQRARRVTP